MLGMFGKAALMYLLLVGVMRLLGKRQLGQMEPSEIAVTMMVADLATVPMQNAESRLSDGVIPILAVLILEFVLSELSVRNIKIRQIMCGKPVILMENGKFLQKNLKKTRITLDEIVSKLREKDVMDLATVQYAILETGGNISVFLLPEHKPAKAKDAGIPVEKELFPVAVISDGRVMTDNLKKAGKDRNWLEKELKQAKLTEKEVFLLTVDQTNRVQIFPKEKKK